MILDPELGRRKMYNLSADPAEKRRRLGNGVRPGRKSAAISKNGSAISPGEILSGKKEPSIDPKAEEMLRSLGYIGK